MASAGWARRPWPSSTPSPTPTSTPAAAGWSAAPACPSLAAAIRTLDVDLGVEFTDAEKLDDTRAAKRILQNLHERAERGAAARAGEPNPPQPRTLLILDNIDDARLLHPPHTDLLSGRTWLHVLATTRLGPQQLSPDDAPPPPAGRRRAARGRRLAAHRELPAPGPVRQR